MTIRLTILLASMLAVAGCGGGGGGGQAPNTPNPPTQPNPPNTPPQGQSQTHRGAPLAKANGSLTGPYAKPGLDLPPDGRDGLKVTRPAHGHSPDVRIVYATPALLDRLEPTRGYDTAAQERIALATQILENLVGKAYFQWTRHLTYDPGPLTLVFGNQRGACSGHNTLACYLIDYNVIAIGDYWLNKNYEKLYSGEARAAIEGMFSILTHEAGHQFGYEHPSGIKLGCGTEDGPRCHAPRGSGSVISYDFQRGLSVRYHVTREDIRHVPRAAWKGGDTDSYSVSKSSGESSIDRWGVSIDHHFVVDGQTSPGELFGGNLSIGDRITGTGWIAGTPSTDVSLTGSATWSGEDNFLGVNLDDDQPGALLRADANLRYTFGNAPNLTLQVNNFEAHYSAERADNVCVNGMCGPGRINADATWHAHGGDFTYSMDCTSGGCSDAQAEAKWYADGAGDPAGWVGGVVNDQGNGYVGSFAAERD